MIWVSAVANCKSCDAEIFFAWDKRFDRWTPVDLNCIRGDEVEYEGGVLRESHHLRHRCGFTSAPPTDGPQPHRVLFIAPDAPIEVVKAAYKVLAWAYHPDRGGSEDAMRELNEAYEACLAMPRNPLR